MLIRWPSPYVCGLEGFDVCRTGLFVWPVGVGSVVFSRVLIKDQRTLFLGGGMSGTLDAQ